jgi:pimeloyl-ACP methyl ester carboxylesterase
MRALALLCLAALLAAFQARAAPCEHPDNLTRVSGGSECLVIKTAAHPVEAERSTLYVLLHGSHSDGSPAVSFYPVADWLAEHGPPGTIAVAMLRPGFRDDRGDRSTGNNNQGGDDFHAHNVDAVAAAVAALKAFHRADRVVLVGHSAGAAVAGVIIGRHAGLANAAVLVGCPCQVGVWRMGRGNSRPWASESPDTYVDRVPPAVRVALLVGAADGETPPSLSEGYAAMLRARGIDAEVTVLEGHGHIGPVRSQRMREAILRMGGAD